ncbi:MAG: preprotein translocase subunit SecG [Proteobacteria bacterium]|nr:preprotein translocase subunit SecG [Pseudomonadota bacterium]
MDIILLVLHVFLSLGIITLVLLQKGAGASAGAAFGGGGGAGSVFGATGSSNFLSKTTAIFAVGFFVNSLVLAYMAAHRDIDSGSVLDSFTPPAIEVPAEAIPSDVPAPEASTEAGVESDAAAVADEELPPADVPAAE